MQGRIKRKLQGQKQAAQAARAQPAEPPRCALCHRPLGARVEQHHRIPRSRGGTETIPLHPICHRAIHAHLSNHELAAAYADLDTLRARPDIARFLHWLRDKPADFHAPTRRKLPESPA